MELKNTKIIHTTIEAKPGAKREDCFTEFMVYAIENHCNVKLIFDDIWYEVNVNNLYATMNVQGTPNKTLNLTGGKAFPAG